MPWISKEELRILKENLKDYRENVRHLNEKLVCEYTEKDKLIENAADLLGYESKKKTEKMVESKRSITIGVPLAAGVRRGSPSHHLVKSHPNKPTNKIMIESSIPASSK